MACFNNIHAINDQVQIHKDAFCLQLFLLYHHGMF